jgi:Fic family protein
MPQRSIPDPSRHRAGRFVTQQSGRAAYAAFVPAPLPPDPPVRFAPPVQGALERASHAIGRLDGVTLLLPDPALFIHMYVRKEAVLSSQIEGTQSSLSDLLLYESDAAPGVPRSDVEEVANYNRAMQHGLERLRGGFPLSLRLVREIHALLVSGTRGGEKAPGEFRTSQNWIGGSRPGDAVFVPPPPHEVMPALADLERFLNATDDGTPLLVRAGLAHAQFETIHPFLDGNGRVGRLLVTFLLCAGGALSQPLLYLSLYLKGNRARYYELLQRVRTHGAWEEWLAFFLDGVAEVGEQATETARRVMALFEEDRRRVVEIGQSAASALRVYDLLRHHPVLTATEAARQAALSFPTASTALRNLERLGIAREVTGRPRDRVYLYQRYVDLLAEGTEPL